MARFVPLSLILLRFLLGPVLLLDALDGRTGIPFVAGIVVGLLSDIFDGIVARRLGVATERLRVADSWVDAFFFACVVAGAWVAYREAILAFSIPLVIMFTTYFLSMAIPFFKFGRFPAYHAYSAKAAGLTLLAAGVALFGFGVTGGIMGFAIVVSTLSNLDRIAISLILPEWANDVAGVWKALELRSARSQP